MAKAESLFRTQKWPCREEGELQRGWGREGPACKSH